MKCLILAAGYATRLYPLTENFPKPLLTIKGKPILDWLIDDISSINLVDEYVVISNHKYYNEFIKWAEGKKQKITVIDDGSISNETRLGAVKDIFFAIDNLKIDDEMLVIAGDNVLDFSLTKFIKYAKSKEASCIMRYYEKDFNRLKKSGIVEVGNDDKIISMEEKPDNPKSNWCCPPFYYYTKEDVKLVGKGIASGCGVDAPGSFIAWLCKNTTIFAMEMPGKRYDIGDIESYKKVENEYMGINLL